ncbi:MAG TPA: hypothetical protein VII25_01150, partial [Candidatus Acidoferrum sp.]
MDMASDKKKNKKGTGEVELADGVTDVSAYSSALGLFHAPVREWFEAVFTAPTRPQVAGWPAIARGESTLILAPT